jgi:hypothetical protein
MITDWQNIKMGDTYHIWHPNTPTGHSNRVQVVRVLPHLIEYRYMHELIIRLKTPEWFIENAYDEF